MYIKDQAIVLNKRSADDASNFYILYTQKRGLQTVKVRGAKKSLSKMAGHLEPPALCEIFVATGRKINYIAGANLLKRFDFDCLEKYRIQFWLVKLILQMIKENSGDIELWILLNKFYNQLENAKDENQANFFKNIFLWNLGDVLGFKISFEKCFSCGEMSEKYFLDFEKGGILCEKCKDSTGKLISRKLLEILRIIKKEDFEKVFKGFSDFNEFDNLSKIYWQYRLEIKL